MALQAPNRLLLLSVALLAGASGCANLVETRAIEQFTAALERQNLEELKSSTSQQFHRLALRNTKAPNDLQILDLPTGETSVVRVEEVSEHEKRVTVETEDSGRKVLYKLVRDEETDEWVVDDVYLREKHRGLQVTKSVTEQMDLLLRVREFLAAWRDGSREEVLEVATPQLKALLEKLPPAYLARLTKRVVADHSPHADLNPEAQLDEDVAVVKLPRRSGDLILSLQRGQGTWHIDDVAVEAPDEGHIPSLRKRIAVLHAVFAFLEAYSAEDRQALQRLCTTTFYRESLGPADLSSVRLPTPYQPQNNYEIKTDEDHATFILPAEGQVVTLELVQNEVTDSESPVGYRIREVTLYEQDSQEKKRLSALLTAQARMQIFSQALAERNLKMVRHITTPEFRKRVWDRLDPETFRRLPLKRIEEVPPQIVDTKFQGALTEITVTQGSQTLTYVLRDWNGGLLVDDVKIPRADRPRSLKKALDVRIPLRHFTTAMRNEKKARVQRHSSQQFNRLVWNQLDSIPDVGLPVGKHLTAEITSITFPSDELARVELGEEQWGAQVQLVKEHGQWVVDEILLIAGPEPSQRTRLRRTLRERLANGTIGPGVRGSEPPFNRRSRPSANSSSQSSPPESFPSRKLAPAP